MNSLFQTLKSNCYLILTFFVASCYFLSQSKWNPDAHHDGIMYAAALASSKGFLSNRDFFAQYGPITPELQGFWLSVFSPTLLSLRYFSAFILIVTTVTLFMIIRNRMGDRNSFLLTSLFAISNPLILNPTLPWSSNLATLFLLLFLLIINKNSRTRYEKTIILIFCITLVIGTLTRIHVFLGFPLAIGLLMFSRNKQKYVKIIQLFLCMLILVACSVFLIWKSGMTYGLYIDFIEWPFSWQMEGRNVRGLINLKIILFSLIFVILLLAYYRYDSSLLVKGLIFISIFSATMVSSSYPSNFKGYANENSLINIFHMALANFRFIVTYTFVAISIIVVVARLRRIRELEFFEILKISIILIGLAQLYPVPDVGHMWMVLPILVTTLTLVPDANSKELKMQSILTNTLSPLVIASTLLFVLELAMPRSALTSPPLQGMLTDNKATIEMDKTITKLGEIATSNSVRFDCSDALYSTAGLKLLSFDRNFVNWGPRWGDQVAQPKYIFSCRKPIDVNYQGYKMLFSDPGEINGEFNSLYQLIDSQKYER